MVLGIMGEMGARYHPDFIRQALEYAHLMLEENRILVIYSGNKPSVIIFFSITDDPLLYHIKPTWHYLSHNPHGKIVVVQKLISIGWNRVMREQLETELIKLYPQLEKAVWIRDSKHGDRHVYTIRRVKECMRLRS